VDIVLPNGVDGSDNNIIVHDAANFMNKNKIVE
jgi:hypothetical protein